MALIPNQLKDGTWTILNTRTQDTFWDTFKVATEAEAKAECERREAAMTALVAKSKAESDARAARRKELKEAMPTDILTSRGDGWEGNSGGGSEPA